MISLRSCSSKAIALIDSLIKLIIIEVYRQASEISFNSNMRLILFLCTTHIVNSAVVVALG